MSFDYDEVKWTYWFSLHAIYRTYKFIGVFYLQVQSNFYDLTKRIKVSPFIVKVRDLWLGLKPNTGTYTLKRDESHSLDIFL